MGLWFVIALFNCPFVHASKRATRVPVLDNTSQVVKTAEKRVLERELSGKENKEYLSMEGLPAFNKARTS